MSRTTRPLSESQFGQTRRAHTETLVNGRQDARRLAGPELGWWSQALAHRGEYPANLWFIGDSMTECFGATDDYHTWVDLVRTAIQGRYRNGGIGYIPAKHAQGATWPYTTNPDGKNTWALTGSEVDNVDYGLGLGRRNSWLTTTGPGTRTITVDCDRFQIVYSQLSGAGSFQIDVDAGTPQALTATFSCASTSPKVGRIWDSTDNGAMTLSLGTHVIKVTCLTANSALDGIMVYYTDALVGVHVFNGGHYGYKAELFNNTAAGSGYWADIAYQPQTPVAFTNFVGNGTTTVTSTTAAFTDLDIGEYIHFEGSAGTPLCTNSMARIIARGSGTSVTVDRTVAAGTWTAILNRAQVTDGVITNGLTTMTSATAAFKPWDVGLYVMGPTGIPTGVYIRRYNSPTSVELSTAATASQSAQTVRFLGRQKYWMAPDCLVVEFGFNELFQGYGTEYWKTNMRTLVSFAKERAGIGFPVSPSITGPQRYNPSVVLLGLWAPGGFGSVSAYVTATNASKIITSNEFEFDQQDIGKTITTAGNTPIGAGNTIASVQSNLQATLTNNAVAGATALATIVNRQGLDKSWQRFRQAQFELAAENNWRFFDLYSLSGAIDVYDPLNLTYDFVHPNNRGAQWIADELDVVLTGQPKSAAIPQGIIDAKGDIIVGITADDAGKLPAGIDGQVLTYASGAPLGVLPMDVSMGSAHGQILPVIGGTTALAIGLPAPTLTATASNADDSEASWINQATSTTQFNPSGVVSAAFTVTRSGRLPSFYSYIKTDPAAITSVAYAIGLSSASLDVASAIAPAAAVVGAYFLYNTTAHGTAFWRTVTSDGTTRNTQTTTSSIAVNTTYRMRILVIGVRGASVSSVVFFINDVLVATHTTNLPTFSTPLGYGVRVETLTTAARNIKWARIGLSGP